MDGPVRSGPWLSHQISEADTMGEKVGGHTLKTHMDYNILQLSYALMHP